MRYNEIIVTISVQIPLSVMLLAKPRLVCLLAVGFVLVWALVDFVLFFAFTIDGDAAGTPRTIRMDVMAVCLTIGNTICSIAVIVATMITWWATKRNLGYFFVVAASGCVIGATFSTRATYDTLIVPSSDAASVSIVLFASLLVPALTLPVSSMMTFWYLYKEKDSDWEQAAKEEAVPINRQPTDTQTKQPV
jgi:hypothetical protein